MMQQVVELMVTYRYTSASVNQHTKAMAGFALVRMNFHTKLFFKDVTVSVCHSLHAMLEKKQ